MISSKKKFVFVHIPKTGGSSVAWAFRKEFDKPNPAQRMAKSIAGRTLGLAIYPSSKFQPLDVHAKAQDYLSFLGDRYWDMQTISFVRNPFDLNVSLYHYVQQNKVHPAHERVKNLSFEQYLHQTCGGSKNPATQTSFLVDEDQRFIVGNIGRLETLKHDFEKFCGAVGISAHLEHINSSRRKREISSYYTPEMATMVVEKFRRDFENFGYSIDLENAKISPMNLAIEAIHPRLNSQINHPKIHEQQTPPAQPLAG